MMPWIEGLGSAESEPVPDRNRLLKRCRVGLWSVHGRLCVDVLSVLRRFVVGLWSFCGRFVSVFSRREFL